MKCILHVDSRKDLNSVIFNLLTGWIVGYSSRRSHFSEAGITAHKTVKAACRHRSEACLCCLSFPLILLSSAPPDHLHLLSMPGWHHLTTDPSATPERCSKIIYAAVQSLESENLIRFPRLPNTILQVVCQANHWAILISHFTEKFLGRWALAAFQKEEIGNACGEATKAVWA